MAYWIAVIGWITAAFAFVGTGLDWSSAALQWTGAGMIVGLWVAGLFGSLLRG